MSFSILNGGNISAENVLWIRGCASRFQSNQRHSLYVVIVALKYGRPILFPFCGFTYEAAEIA